jgi:hypothetical protein
MYNNDGPKHFFPALYNNGKGAKIANGSWSSLHRQYSSSCRAFDEALYEDYQDLVFAVSTGNTGDIKDGNDSLLVGDPAACKNTLGGKWQEFNIFLLFVHCLIY